jgi:cell division protein FtsB
VSISNFALSSCDLGSRATTEFAFEIGSGLLTEVRRLQSLLAERDKAIQDMKEEKDDLEKSVEGLRTGLRQQEQNAGQSPCTTAR